MNRRRDRHERSMPRNKKRATTYPSSFTPAGLFHRKSPPPRAGRGRRYTEEACRPHARLQARLARSQPGWWPGLELAIKGGCEEAERVLLSGSPPSSVSSSI